MHKKRKFRHLQNCTEMTAYLYIIGILIKLSDVIKNVVMGVIRNITELLMCLSIVGMVAAANAFEEKAINYTTAILFITILVVLLLTLVKVKILERGGKK